MPFYCISSPRKNATISRNDSPVFHWWIKCQITSITERYIQTNKHEMPLNSYIHRTSNIKLQIYVYDKSLTISIRRFEAHESKVMHYSNIHNCSSFRYHRFHYPDWLQLIARKHYVETHQPKKKKKLVPFTVLMNIRWNHMNN